MKWDSSTFSIDSSQLATFNRILQVYGSKILEAIHIWGIVGQDNLTGWTF